MIIALKNKFKKFFGKSESKTVEIVCEAKEEPQVETTTKFDDDLEKLSNAQTEYYEKIKQFKFEITVNGSTYFTDSFDVQHGVLTFTSLGTMCPKSISSSSVIIFMSMTFNTFAEDNSLIVTKETFTVKQIGVGAGE